MAESVFSYEEDIAPQKGSYFSEIPRSRYGVTYSTPDTRRYAAGVLGPMYRANREAEEAELKRRDDELMFQRNRLLVEQAQAEAKLQAEVLAMQPELTARLEEINAMADPVAKKDALTSFVLQNPRAALSDSFKAPIDIISRGIEELREEQKATKSATDASLYNQVIIYADVDINKAAEAAAKISDSNMQSQAAALVASTAEKNRLSQDFNKSKEEKAEAEKRKTDVQRTNDELLKIAPEPVVGRFGSDNKPLLEYSPESLNKIRAYGVRLGLDPVDVDEQIATDPHAFKRKLEEITTVPFTSSGGGGKVGGITEQMLGTP